ncbi:hypothetical protein N7509_011555 [Penicillium cosmopolitanum]|uniref:NADH-ubiquinone oxidoreductase B15 subunit n=1 Tax=Penicillium cosmopolitanum TaxID=1131564 RepID=A0A9W9SH03_9EURO|nr:uncharacterized protein N7509_011555 [Penicillium cosmopolitanum]KAJ5378436.1 hypothetical protein N7509_011555 [Penicillium cosmopolitanum]
MAGPSKSLVLDPALQKYYELNANRYKYFKWTPRHAWTSIIYAIAIPATLTLVAYKTEVGRPDLPTRGKGRDQFAGNFANSSQGLFELRGKRKGDTMVEW